MNVVKNSNKIEIKNKPVIDIIITIIIPSRNITTTANQINSNSEKKKPLSEQNTAPKRPIFKNNLSSIIKNTSYSRYNN